MTTNSQLAGGRAETQRASPILQSPLSAQPLRVAQTWGLNKNTQSHHTPGLGSGGKLWVPWVLWKSFRGLVLNLGMLDAGSRVRFGISGFRGRIFRSFEGG